MTESTDSTASTTPLPLPSAPGSESGKRSRGQRLLRWLFGALGRVMFFVGFVLVAVYAPMLVLVALGQLQAGLPAGPLEAVPSLAALIIIPGVGGLMMAGGTLMRRRLGGAGIEQQKS